ncbi:hypothetical protein CR513_53513, partial [Mucuna pruriens]
KIWFGKDVKYDHLRVFGCKAFVHVPKDERSKLDMKTRQCIFIGYGHDEYGYMMYDPVEKKLVRSRDVQFIKDQTIEDIYKVKKSTPKKDNSLSKIDPVQMPIHDLDTTNNNIQNGEQHNYGGQQLEDEFDVPLDDDAEQEQEMSQDENLGDALELPPVQLRRSNRQRQSSTRDSCKLGKFLSAALCHHIGGALLVFPVPYYLPIIKVMVVTTTGATVAANVSSGSCL